MAQGKSTSILSETLRGFVASEPGRGLRLTLLSGDALSLPDSARNLCIDSGTAWVSVDGEDILLEGGECFGLPRKAKHGAVISATAKQALSFELA